MDEDFGSIIIVGDCMGIFDFNTQQSYSNLGCGLVCKLASHTFFDAVLLAFKRCEFASSIGPKILNRASCK